VDSPAGTADNDAISDDGDAGMAHFGSINRRRNLDDLPNRPCLPSHHQQGRVSTNHLKPDTHHDFAGTLAGGGVAIQLGGEGVAQDRPGGAAVDRPVDGSGHRRWQRDHHHLAAFAAHAQDPVAVLLAAALDVGAVGLEDP
jgi:hypothetical protein